MNGATILVVEDEPLVGMEIQDQLIQRGYQVPEVVANGDEVQAAMDRCRPDLVLMDIRIPGTLDGVQAAALLRQSSDVPLLFMTAYSDAAVIKRAAEVLPDGYIIKSYGERELTVAIEVALLKAKSPVNAVKNLKKMVPLLEALDPVLILFDGQGHWVHGNRRARESLGLTAWESPGPSLTDLLKVTRQEFDADPRHWADRTLPLSVESLPGPDGLPGGYVAALKSDTSSRALNQALTDLLPLDGLFQQRIDSAGFLVPSTSGTGDFYDIFPLGPHHFVFYSLDVEGSGPLPAMVVYSLRSVIRELSGTYLVWHEDVPAPSVLLKALNEKYENRFKDSLFFTMALGILAPMTGEFQLVRAGHTRPLWLGADGSVHWLQGKGSGLGAFPEVSFEDQSGRLQSGDRLILYSDGLVEALGNRDLDRGCSVLAELVKANTHKDPRITAAAVRKACLQALPEHADDMSLLILGPGSLSDRGMYAPGLSDPFGVDFEGKMGGETI